jgi:hypothetical protein
MKKNILIAAAGIALLAAGGLIAFRSVSGEKAAAAQTAQVSPKSAESLQIKIDAIKKADEIPDRAPGASHVELSEAELESYVLYSLAADIPAHIDSFHVQLGQDTVVADTQLTFAANATGNPVVDTFIGGTHNLLLKGKLVAQQGRGKFDLEEVHVDGIPVPNILIQALLDKYVKPKYPDVDLKEPFDMPWGIEELKLQPGKAIVVY